MNRLISFFSRPLPQNDNGNWLQAGLIAGAIVFFLLFFLRPFGLGQFEGNLFIVALGAMASVFSSPGCGGSRHGGCGMSALLFCCYYTVLA